MKRASKPNKDRGKRHLGLFRGEIWMAPDFDAPMELIESAKLSLLEAGASRNRKKKAKPCGAATKNSRRR